ncbi:uncharacterized protein LOC119367608 [Triticum dicoccoides]|uniref:uncharacterized protein LOC119367608 n=1 Tax=Triticum dicoccoides TaxID=85692 RepID=UPI00188E2EAB|nr:uncharacterized protein LOC119367608 [Triticum dicoccoides]
MDGDGELPFDFFLQTASSGAVMHHIDEDGWGMTPPRLRGSAGRGLVAGGRGSVAGGLGRGSVAGGLRAPIGLENIDLNGNSAVAASYPSMGMYTHLFHPESAANHGVPLQRTRSDGVVQRQGRPPRQGLPPVRAPDHRGKQVVATSGRGGAGSSRSGSGR